ncbi:MAG TPA: IS66 family insertion sequence element accessory protein TnpB [Solirubrobacteraceae bacterium]|nr:IS66 family insertion sequence element accessory protein TnpB [Solirubrobacteraceae bacterium]
MIRLPPAIFVATTAVDLHWSFDRLAGLVREQLGGDPRSETLFVFHNKRRTHLKLLWHDGTGYCVLYKRLDRGAYRIPMAIPQGASRVVVSERELHLLLEGIDRAVLRAARRTVRGTEQGEQAPRPMPSSSPV